MNIQELKVKLSALVDDITQINIEAERHEVITKQLDDRQKALQELEKALQKQGEDLKLEAHRIKEEREYAQSLREKSAEEERIIKGKQRDLDKREEEIQRLTISFEKKRVEVEAKIKELSNTQAKADEMVRREQICSRQETILRERTNIIEIKEKKIADELARIKHIQDLTKVG